MGTKRRRFLALATIPPGAPFASGHAFAQAAKPQASETNIDGVTAEISEASRKEGVLTVKMRLRNTGSANAKVQISGDSRDVKGERNYNQKLSQRRAESVRKWLAAHGASLRMTTRGFGAAKPVAPNAKPDGSDDRKGGRRTGAWKSW